MPKVTQLISIISPIGKDSSRLNTNIFVSKPAAQARISKRAKEVIGCNVGELEWFAPVTCHNYKSMQMLCPSLISRIEILGNLSYTNDWGVYREGWSSASKRALSLFTQVASIIYHFFIRHWRHAVKAPTYMKCNIMKWGDKRHWNAVQHQVGVDYAGYNIAGLPCP